MKSRQYSHLLCLIFGITLSSSALAQENIFRITSNTTAEIKPSNEEDQDTPPTVALIDRGGVWVRTVNGVEQPLPSCQAYINEGLGQGQSGTYLTTIQGGLPVYCNMSRNGEGWTLAARQREASPVSWTSGVNSAYNPLASSFALNEAQLPAGRTQVNISCPRENEGFVIGGASFNFAYTTGNIPKTRITRLDNNQGYWIHRNTSHYYRGHNPDRDLINITSDSSSNAVWRNTLTFNIANNTSAYNWTFGPEHSDVRARGYACSSNLGSSTTGRHWLLWVR